MTKSTITRERLAKIKSWRETYGAGSNVMLPAEEAEELARIALAAIDSKPFAYIIQDKYERERGVDGHLSRSHVSKYVSQEDINEHEITCIPLYRHAQPVPVVSADLLHTAASAIEDLLTNKDRTGAGVWFDLPFRLRSAANEQTAPVVDADDNFYSWFGREWAENYQHNQYTTAAKQMLGVMAESAWKAGRRAAMLAAAPQSPGSEPATVPGKWIPVSERMPIEFEAVIAFDGDQVYGEAMYSSDDGFTIDGYEPCDRLNLQNVTHWMPLPAAPQEVKGE